MCAACTFGAPRTQEVGTRARLAAIQLMTGVARIRDPHSATVRAIKPVYVKNFNSSARVTTGRAFLARRGLPRPLGKSAAPRGRAGSAPRPAREPSAPTALIKCSTLHTYPFVASLLCTTYHFYYYHKLLLFTFTMIE